MGLSDAPVIPTIRYENLEEAKDFYAEKLGLELVKEDMGGVLFKAGKGSHIFIYEGPKSVAEHTVAAFHVEDLEAAVKELKEKGVKFESYDMEGLKTDENNIATWEEFKTAWFTDPEGHIFALDNGKKD